MKLLKRFFLFMIIFQLLIPTTLADGIFIPPSDEDISEPQQKAAIHCMYNTEKLLLSVRYSGKIESFAWLVPTPSIPEVTEGDYKVFEDLNSMLGSRPNTYEKGFVGSSLEDNESASDVVEVISRAKVGVYDVSVLDAVNSTGLANWLNSNGYSYPVSKAGLFDYYINKSWTFTAMRISPDEYTSEIIGQLKSGEIEPLIFTFTTDQCIFPLRISQGNQNVTNIILYVIGDSSYKTSKLSTILSNQVGIPNLQYYEHLADFLGYADVDFEDYTYEDYFMISKLHHILDPAEMDSDIILTPVSDPKPASLASYGISDVYGNYDFYPYIEYLVSHGIDSGFNASDTDEYYFKPDIDIKRGDFTKFVVKIIGLDTVENSVLPFQDVKTSDLNYNYIRIAYALDLIKGYPDMEFKPDRTITRGEAMKILAGALDYVGVVNLDDIEQLYGDTQFIDVPHDYEFYKFILAAAKLGLIDGYGDLTFRPNKQISRGQSAKVVMEGLMLVHSP